MKCGSHKDQHRAKPYIKPTVLTMWLIQEGCKAEHEMLKKYWKSSIKNIKYGLLTLVQWYQPTKILLPYHGYRKTHYSSRLLATDLHFKLHQCCQHQFTSVPHQCRWIDALRAETRQITTALITGATCYECVDTDWFYVARLLARSRQRAIFFAPYSRNHHHLMNGRLYNGRFRYTLHWAAVEGPCHAVTDNQPVRLGAQPF